MSTPFPSDSIAQLVERWTGVPEGGSSNLTRVNSFSVDVSSVRSSLENHRPIGPLQGAIGLDTLV